MVSKPLSASTEDLLATVKLPPHPTEDQELQALESQFQRLHNKEDSESSYEDDDTSSSTSSFTDTSPRTPQSAPAFLPSIADDLRKLHANLEARLTPFWSSVLPNRTVQIHLFASPLSSPHAQTSKSEQEAISHGPIASRSVVTLADGSFEAKFRIKWEDLCQHPAALHIAFGERGEEHEFVATAEIMRPPISRSTPDLRLDTESIPASISTTENIVLTHAPMRIISDIDDTVKRSDVPGGARTIFHNVFVRELQELIIPGVGEWYMDMWKQGVRFHYVVSSIRCSLFSANAAQSPTVLLSSFPSLHNFSA
jgi:hypothetical protein